MADYGYYRGEIISDNESEARRKLAQEGFIEKNYHNITFLICIECGALTFAGQGKNIHRQYHNRYKDDGK